MTRKKRRYTRLSPSTWAEIRGCWETGDHDLAELSDRYGVSRRALQTHFAKNGCVKAAAAAAMAVAVKAEIIKQELGDPDTLILRARETREAAYNHATIIEALIMAQLAHAQKDPTYMVKASSALKALSLAASGLERSQGIRLRALGLDKENAPSDVMPELIIRDLSKEDLTKIKEHNEDGEEDDLDPTIATSTADSAFAGTETDESDDIVIEGDGVVIEDDGVIVEGEGGMGSDEREEPAKPRSTVLDIHGGRLVKEARP
jgi:hypothetical protein